MQQYLFMPVLALSIAFSHISHIVAQAQPDTYVPDFHTGQLISYDTRNCNPDALNLAGQTINQTANLLTAFQDANTLAHAGIIAAATPAAYPYKYFFHPADNATVASYLQTVVDLTSNPSRIHAAAIVLTCHDPDWCKTSSQWGFAAKWHRSAYQLAFCDFGLTQLARNPVPCAAGPSFAPGLPTLGWLGVKLLLQTWPLVPGVVNDHTDGLAGCHELLAHSHGRELDNAESFAFMASVAYGLGLKGDGPYYGESCRWRFDAVGNEVLPEWLPRDYRE